MIRSTSGAVPDKHTHVYTREVSRVIYLFTNTDLAGPGICLTGEDWMRLGIDAYFREKRCSNQSRMLRVVQVTFIEIGELVVLVDVRKLDYSSVASCE